MADVEDDDEFDDLFNYDIDNIQTTFNANAEGGTATTAAKGKGKDDGDLGVDEEIKIRKRKPAVKLTEDKLLGPEGIPYIQAQASKKIKFKGKGHEITDLGRILKFYQIWADNLYPKANFKDAIDMIEKLGSSRGMHNRRDEWIEEYKMKTREEDERLISKARELLEKESGEVYIEASRSTQAEGAPKNDQGGEASDNLAGSKEQANKDAGDSLFFQDEDDDMDDLDAIMREAEGPQTSAKPSVVSAPAEDFDDDELDAIMREMEGASTSKPPQQTSRKVVQKTGGSDDEFEEAMAAMRENER